MFWELLSELSDFIYLHLSQSTRYTLFSNLSKVLKIFCLVGILERVNSPVIR